MKLSIQAGSTSQTVNVFIQDSSSNTGAGLTGLVFNTSGLTAYYGLPKAASVQITLATLAAVTSAWSSGGFKEIDATNMPGWYRFDIPDAALASGRFVSVHFQGAANMAPLPLEIELTGWNNQDATRGGMTALPNANAEAAGGLYTRGTGAGQIKQTNNGEIDSNTTHMNNVATTPITTIKAVQGLTTADVVASVTGAVGSVTGNVGGNVTGSVGSVTGAVGSVTGNVGGNVVGSVASVTAAVAVTSNVKKNQALAGFTFLMTDSTTHAPQTGLTVSVSRSINGGAFGSGTLGTPAEVGNGIYSVSFGAGDLNGNVIILKATATAADVTFVQIITQP